jgi:hypothetical protein
MMVRPYGATLFTTLLLSLAASRIAAADVLPPDACFSEGQNCFNALGAAGRAGICEKSKCQRPAPPGEAGAGGDGIIIYDCLRCRPILGTGGVPSSGGASATGGAASSGAAGESGGVAATGGSGDAGAGATASGGTAGATANAGEGGETASNSSGCDCGFQGYRSEHSLALLMITAGLLLTRTRRR